MEPSTIGQRNRRCAKEQAEVRSWQASKARFLAPAGFRALAALNLSCITLSSDANTLLSTTEPVEDEAKH